MALLNEGLSKATFAGFLLIGGFVGLGVAKPRYQNMFRFSTRVYL